MEVVLNSLQHKVAGLLMLSFRTNYNSWERKIKAPKILAAVRERGYKLGDAELRQIIGHIRRNDLCQPGFILSDRNGYWYSEDADEMEIVWRAERSRALNILANFQPLNKRFRHLISEKDSIFIE